MCELTFQIFANIGGSVEKDWPNDVLAPLGVEGGVEVAAHDEGQLGTGFQVASVLHLHVEALALLQHVLGGVPVQHIVEHEQSGALVTSRVDKVDLVLNRGRFPRYVQHVKYHQIGQQNGHCCNYQHHHTFVHPDASLSDLFRGLNGAEK